MLSRISYALLVVFVVALFANGQAEEGGALQKAEGASVTVWTDDQQSGSGVCTVNGEHTFVWTDAHVVETAQSVKAVVDKAGKVTAKVTYKDVFVGRSVYEDGRKVGEESRLARVIAFGRGEDLAVLKVYSKDWAKTGTTFSGATAPNKGAPVWHVGSPGGFKMGAHQSVSDGVMSGIGRLRKLCGEGFIQADADGIVWDQITTAATFGCSGGGAFCKKTGHCLGLVSHGGNNCIFISPARRIREFAQRNGVAFAVDQAVPVPAAIQVSTDDDIIIEKG